MSRTRAFALAAFGSSALSFVLTAPAAADRADDVAKELQRHAHVRDEIVVQYRAGVSQRGKAAARGRVGGQRKELLLDEKWRADKDGGGELELVRIPPGHGVANAVRDIEEDPAVAFAEPNFVYTHQAASNDSYYTSGYLWGMYGDATSPRAVYGSQAGEAWAANKTNCSTVWVGIIDTGVMYSHPDLNDNYGRNPGEIGGNGKDDDGNGYRDDVRGWDFAANNNSVFDGAADDHGTHVAGTIGGEGGNGQGVAGVCWKVKLLAGKFLGPEGGSLANALRAIDYFTDLKKRHGINLVATNNSWGGGGYSQALYDAIERARAADILFVAAAGNGGLDGYGDNNDVIASYPASYPNANVISVASITSSGGRSSFSNYGATSVDIAAPGSSIVSTVPVRKLLGGVSAGYATFSGTSMATPHVTGAAALYKARHPAATGAQIKSAILASAVPTPSMAGMCVTGGRLDVSGF
ncbi:MAG TPA: S8 family peptidase [Candidatus Limnocylindrales bacterium]|nr:S8 family peptidase [Candidatus Limnocylindrales bacterium]